MLLTSQQSMAEADGSAMTLDRWADRGEDEPGELVDGRLVEEEDPDAEHDIVGAWLVWILQGEGLVLDLEALWAKIDQLPAD